jgi:hypothetical protein
VSVKRRNIKEIHAETKEDDVGGKKKEESRRGRKIERKLNN